MTSTKNQTGSTAITAVVIVLALLVVGGAGYFVYHRNRTKPVVSSTTPPATTSQPSVMSPSSKAQSDAELTTAIPELGIKLNVNASIKGLTYHYETTKLPKDQTGQVAYFSTDAIAKSDPKCSAEEGPLGALMRVNGQYPNDDQYAVGDYGHLIKQFPTYFITFSQPNGSCTNNPETLRLINTASTPFSLSIKSVDSVQ